MKKIKLITSLSTLGVLGVSVPLVATACNSNSDKPTVRFSNAGMNCGIDHIEGQDCLFVNDYGDESYDVQFVFSLSKDDTNAEFEVKLNDKSFNVEPVMSEKLYYVVTIPASDAKALPDDKVGVNIIISEKNNKINPTTLVAFKGAAITDAETKTANVKLDTVLNPSLITYTKEKTTPTNGVIRLKLSTTPTPESSDPLTFSVIKFGDGEEYSNVETELETDGGVSYIKVTFKKELNDTTSEQGITDVLSIYCMNAKQNVQPFTFILIVGTESE